MATPPRPRPGPESRGVRRRGGAEGAAGRGCYTPGMKRSVQEVVELVVFALIALLVGTGVVWLVGWILGLAGTLLTWLAGLVWSLLRFLVPIALVAGAVYLLVRLMNRSASKVAREPQPQPATPPSPQTKAREAAAARAAGADASTMATSASAAAAATSSAATDPGDGDTSEADAAPHAGSEPSETDEPQPPATNRWEGEGGSVTTGDETGDDTGDDAGDATRSDDDEDRRA